MDRDSAYKTIDEYIAQFPPEVQARLVRMRETIRASAPDASEKISYAMPTFYLNGNLVHFAAFRHHIGFFPGADGIAAFRDKMTGFEVSKGGVQFPHDRPLPLALVTAVTTFRVGQNRAKQPKKTKTPDPASKQGIEPGCPVLQDAVSPEPNKS